MKILMVNRVLYRRSNAENEMFRLGEALQGMGHQVSFFALDDPRNLPLKDAYVIKHPPMSSGRALRVSLFDRGAREHMLKRILADRPDLALVWQVNRTLTYSVVDALAAADVPVWVILTDFTPVCPAQSLARNGSECRKCLVHRNAWPCFLHRCDGDRWGKSFAAALESQWMRLKKRWDLPNGYLVPSEYHRLMMERGRFTHAPIKNVGVPLAEQAFLPQQTRRGEYLLYVGRLEMRKGIVTLLDALQQCVAALPLLVVGDGPEMERLRQIVREFGLQNRVNFTGQIGSDPLRRAMAGCLCLVVPSECEEIAPWALLEAQAMGKPAIVSDRSVLPERIIAGKNGLVFRHHSSPELAQCLDAMAEISDEDYQSMCACARENALEQYTPTAFAERVLEAVGAVGS